MPQLDIDLLEDFMFFAFIAFILGFGDEESEENVINLTSEAYLAQYYLSTRKALSEESYLVSKAPSILFIFFNSSCEKKFEDDYLDTEDDYPDAWDVNPPDGENDFPCPCPCPTAYNSDEDETDKKKS